MMPIKPQNLAQVLVENGLPCAEVTFRTPAAAQAIRNMREAYPDMLIGSGTVLTAKQVDESIEAGVDFVVSPGLESNHSKILPTTWCTNYSWVSTIQVSLSKRWNWV